MRNLLILAVICLWCMPMAACPLHTQAEEPSRESVKK